MPVSVHFLSSTLSYILLQLLYVKECAREQRTCQEGRCATLKRNKKGQSHSEFVCCSELLPNATLLACTRIQEVIPFVRLLQELACNVCMYEFQFKLFVKVYFERLIHWCPAVVCWGIA
ncbi:hypothetical protein, unlikely [Trypanosoma brucei gambiense DAL972]|uniref:T. brucei spp.-specific protein n=1 Tax=Trypanosoma brucei gambiense (strain MHOM/CI/86/DAL972) TaxID=679716 RepID=C9ZMG3_TRYB9|nr:hypothetical protein, unlikely [Trypanosoma brucei gambiense DAL972]CBH10837.1 hypothetical protein, unlikely [Trypanosoma brucei gambiense DAL972]|eukprot:XP_011773124.1 hypothetical protein, unlikely [Trypanosoma brucei gambiense DAL972]